jgi:uncharacterized membrane protein YgaE (UPF0421/DUF939 family)
MMKHHLPIFLFIIPVGVLLIVLALVFALNLDRIVSVLSSVFLGRNSGNSEILFYVVVALVPVLSGTLMALAIIILSRNEDREYERLWKEARDTAPPFYDEFSRYCDSIDASIAKLRDASEKIKHQAEKLEGLSRSMAEKSALTVVKVEEPSIYSVTMEEAKVTNLRIIHPVDGLIPQEPVSLPQFHQKIWFFPRK